MDEEKLIDLIQAKYGLSREESLDLFLEDFVRATNRIGEPAFIDPDGLETYEEDGRRAFDINLKPWDELIAEVTRRAKADPDYETNSDYAIEKAAHKVTKETLKKKKPLISAEEK
jgi:hypothetical protein